MKCRSPLQRADGPIFGQRVRYTRSLKSGTMCRIGDLVLAGWVAKLASAVQPTRGSDPRLISKLGDCVELHLPTPLTNLGDIIQAFRTIL